MNSKISFFISILFSLHFAFKIASLISNSGGAISTIIPPSNLDLNLSSRPGMPFGEVSEERIICFCDCWRILKI